jgi:hypothetical protein
VWAQIHDSKHHATYVTNFNAAMEKYKEAEVKGDVGAMIALQGAIKFNGGGACRPAHPVARRLTARLPPTRRLLTVPAAVSPGRRQRQTRSAERTPSPAQEEGGTHPR